MFEIMDIHKRLPMVGYLAIQAWSSSRLKSLLFDAPEISASSANFGNLVHLYFEHGAAWADKVIVAPRMDMRTKAGKEKRAELDMLAIERGAIVVSADDWTAASRICPEIDGCRLAPIIRDSETDHEITIVARHIETGIVVRIRPDALNRKAAMIVDLKTTQDASPRKACEAIAKFHYLLQAALYADVCEALDGVPYAFWWTFAGKTVTPRVSCIECDDAGFLAGRRLYQGALRIAASDSTTRTRKTWQDELLQYETPEWYHTMIDRVLVESRAMEVTT